MKMLIKIVVLLIFGAQQAQALQIKNTQALEDVTIAIWNQSIDALKTQVQGLEHHKYDPAKPATYDPDKKRVRLPMTDANRTFIIDTVKQVVKSAPIKSDIFADQSTRGWLPAVQKMWASYWNMNQFRNMMTRVMTNCFIEFALKDQNKKMNWCTCIAEPKRIALVILMATDARNSFAVSKKLIYTSFASGGLMQDYLLVSELFETFTDIDVNLIDLVYPDVLTLKAVKKQEEKIKREKKKGYSARLEHMDSLIKFHESAQLIDMFKTRIAQQISLKNKNKQYHFEVTVYDNGYQYAQYAQKNPDEKSDILYLTDPAVGYDTTAQYPALANVVDIWINASPESSVFTLFMPHHQGVQLYELTNEDVHMDKSAPSPKFEATRERLRDSLLDRIKHIGADKQYKPQLVQNLLGKPMASGTLTIQDLEKLGFSAIVGHWQSNRWKLSELCDLKPFQIGTIPVLISLGVDPHVNFQDLVWQVLKPNALVYKLYHTDLYKLYHTDLSVLAALTTARIIKVDPVKHKYEDVISKNGGGGEWFTIDPIYKKKRVLIK